MTELDDNGPLDLSPKQRRSIAGATQRVNIWHGSVSSGKTIASILAWLHFVAFEAPQRGELIMVGNTLQSLERNVLNVIDEMAPGVIQHTTGAPTAKIFGRVVHTIGANDARAERRIRGVTAAGFYIDEASLLPNEGYWQQVLNRMRVVGARLFATTNPDNPTHWLKLVIDRAAELGYAVWHFLLEDNPGLTAEYLEAIKRENTGLWFKRNIEGLWVLAEGAIWDMWDEAVHLLRTPTPEGDGELGPYTLAIDYGTAGVFAAGLLAPTDSKLHALREWRYDARKKQRQMTDAQYSAALRNWLEDLEETFPGCSEPHRIFVDPSASSFITQLHNDGWRRVYLADNGNNADSDAGVLDGIRNVASLLAADLLDVHESVQGLRDEIPGYVWDPKHSAVGKDKPVKVNDHSCDWLRYGVQGTERTWWRWLRNEQAQEAA